MQSQSTNDAQVSIGNPSQDVWNLNLTDDTGGDSLKNQDESNKEEEAGENAPKWPFGQEEALKDTDQQKEAVEEYIAPKGNTLGAE